MSSSVLHHRHHSPAVLTISSYKVSAAMVLTMMAYVGFLIYYRAFHPAVGVLVGLYVCHTLYCAKAFSADERGIIVSGPYYLFVKKPRLFYADIVEIRCSFPHIAAAGNSIAFSMKDGSRPVIEHYISRKRLTPLLITLAERGIPIIIHDVKNDDLLN